jgi:hypothetical protein
MSQISAIDTLECVVDGDTIVPRMAFVMGAGVGTTQYYNPTTKVCSPDYTDTNTQIMLYPCCYSSNAGKYVVPTEGTERWYFNNPDSSEALIVDPDTGNVKEKYKNYFTNLDDNGNKLTYTVNGQTFPALKIIGNLAGENSINSYNQDVAIYFKGEINGVSTTCHGDIAIRETVGNVYDIVLSCVNEGGHPDTVIDSDSETLEITADLQLNGASIQAGAWSWKKASAGNLIDIVTKGDLVKGVVGVTVSNDGKTITLTEAAIDSTEQFYAVATLDGNTYTKGIEVCDTHDPYYIEMGRSTASNLIRATETVTYTPQVLARASRTTQTNWTFSYAILDYNGSTIVSGSVSNGKFNVSGATVQEYGQVTVYIEATGNG